MAHTSKREKTGQAPIQKCFHVGIYARLSVDRANASQQKDCSQARKNESIDTQIAIAKQYLKEHPEMELYSCYTDLGRTGTNFKRGGFERMMQDVREKRINCIIVKDLSRFGRNHIETGNYIQKIFPFMGVRFIALTDGIDTFEEKSSIDAMAINLKNLVNEMYARDIAEKVRVSKNSSQEQGSYTGGIPPYGYNAGWLEDRRCLFICPETAEIVRDIYGLFLSGKNMRQIAEVLYRRKIHRPAIYRKTGNVYRQEGEVLEQWGTGTIKRILTNPVYMGCLAHGTTHEPIISENVFLQVAALTQKSAEKYRYIDVSAKKIPIEDDIYAGVLFCGECGKRMVRLANEKKLSSGKWLRYYSYHCPASHRLDELQCPTESIGKSALDELVKIALHQEFVLSDLRPDKLAGEYEKQAEEWKWQLKKKLLQCGKELECGKKRGSELYMKYRMGTLSLEEFRQMKEGHQRSQQEISEKKEELLQKLGSIEKEINEKEQFLRNLMESKETMILTKDIINVLIGRIEIYAGYRVRITFAFCEDGLLY